MTEEAQTPSRDTLDAENAAPDRFGVVAIAASALLVFVGFAKWNALIYPNYLAGAALQTLVLALAVYWAFARAFGIPVGRPRGLADLLLAFYAVYAAAACLWSDNTRLAAIGSLLVLFPVFWARGLGQTLRGAADRGFLLRAFFVAGTVAGAVGIGYVLAAGKVEAIEHAQGHRNFLAIFLLPCLLIWVADLFAPALAPGARRGCVLRWPVWATATGAAVMLVALVLCRSVGSVLGMAVGIACLLAMRLRSAQRRLLLASAAAIAALALFVVSTPRVMEMLLERAPSQATRWFLWEGTARMIGDRPLLGWGTGTFQLYFADYKPTWPMRYGILETTTVYPHNEFLLVAVEGGLLGLALYLAALFFVVRGHLRAAERSPDPADRLARWAIFAGFAAMSAQGLVAIALRYWGPATAYWTLAGLMLASPSGERGIPERSRREPVALGAARIILTLILVTLPLAGIVWQGLKAEWLMAGGQAEKGLSIETRAARYFAAERASRYVPDGLLAIRDRAEMYRKAGHAREAIAAYEHLNRVAPGYGPVRRLLGALYLERAREVGPVNEAEGMRCLKESIAYLERAVAQYPYDRAAQAALARVSQLASERGVPIEHSTLNVER